MPADLILLLAAGVVCAGLAVALVVVLRRTDRAAERLQADAMAALADQLRAENRELAGRLSQLGDDTRKVQAELTRAVNDRLDQVSVRMGKSLEEAAGRTAKSFGEIATRLKVIDEAQKNLSDLSGEIVGLQDILSDKQARGAFGELQLTDLVSAILPPSAYDFQVKLSNDRRVDCLIKLPNPPGPMGVDAKFPLEGYQALQAARDEAQKVAAGRAFKADIAKHVKNIAERYILPGETADSALMFLPSEAVYAELHANFPDVVQKSFQAKVWIVSPTTLWATLNTVRAILKDARIREQAHVVQKEMRALMDDVRRLGERVDKLDTHFNQAQRDIADIRTSTDGITRHAGRIEAVELDGEDGEHAVEPNKPVRLVRE